jgi:hypothetical protein
MSDLTKGRQTYAENRLKMDKHNDLFKKGKINYNLAPNEFMHLTADEFLSKRTYRNGNHNSRPKRAAPQYWTTVPTCTTFPPYKNYNDEGKVHGKCNRRKVQHDRVNE